MNADTHSVMTQNCIVCELVLPEIETQNQRLKKENQRLRLEHDPLHPTTRTRMVELERQVATLSEALHSAVGAARELIKSGAPQYGHELAWDALNATVGILEQEVQG